MAKGKAKAASKAVEKKKVGRPPADCFKSPEEFERRAREYFDWCDKNDELKTITGLAVHLGTWRKNIMNYEEKAEFSHAIKKVKAVCEREYERIALTARNPAGAIFILKNMGWSDKQEHEHSGEQEIIINIKGLYGQPGDIPLPADAVIVDAGEGGNGGSKRNAIAAASGGNGGGNGNGGR